MVIETTYYLMIASAFLTIYTAPWSEPLPPDQSLYKAPIFKIPYPSFFYNIKKINYIELSSGFLLVNRPTCIGRTTDNADRQTVVAKHIKKQFHLIKFPNRELFIIFAFRFIGNEKNICKKYFEKVLGKTYRFRTVFKNMV